MSLRKIKPDVERESKYGAFLIQVKSYGYGTDRVILTHASKKIKPIIIEVDTRDSFDDYLSIAAKELMKPGQIDNYRIGDGEGLIDAVNAVLNEVRNDENYFTTNRFPKR